MLDYTLCVRDDVILVTVCKKHTANLRATCVSKEILTPCVAKHMVMCQQTHLRTHATHHHIPHLKDGVFFTWDNSNAAIKHTVRRVAVVHHIG